MALLVLAIIVGAATGTRLMGVALFFVLVWHLWQDRKKISARFFSEKCDSLWMVITAILVGNAGVYVIFMVEIRCSISVFTNLNSLVPSYVCITVASD